MLSENPFTLVAACLFALFVLLALFGPWIAPYDPLATNTGMALQPPSRSHWFGTDSLGRDILSRVIVATRLDFGIACRRWRVRSPSAGCSAPAPASSAAGWTASSIRLSDTIMAFPLFVLAMGIVAALGNTVANIVLATAIINLPFYIRVARAEVNVRREAGFVEAARLAGNGDARILLCTCFPTRCRR